MSNILRFDLYDTNHERLNVEVDLGFAPFPGDVIRTVEGVDVRVIRRIALPRNNQGGVAPLDGILEVRDVE